MARSGPGWGRESAFLTSFPRKACPMTPNSNSGEATAAPPPVRKGFMSMINRQGMCPLCGLYGTHAHTDPEINRLRQQVIEQLESWWLADA